MITIGVHYGGPEHQGTLIHDTLSATMRALKKFRDPNFQNGDAPWVNPIFILPGSISQPDFEGTKIGHYSKRQKGVVVMIAVPQLVADGVEMHEFIVQSLMKASEIASAFFAEKDEVFHFLAAQTLIKKVERELQQRA